MQTAAELSSETPKRIAMSVTSAKPKRKALLVLERKLTVGPKKSRFAIRMVKLFNEVFSGSANTSHEALIVKVKRAEWCVCRSRRLVSCRPG
jgi:hypothetical protein